MDFGGTLTGVGTLLAGGTTVVVAWRGRKHLSALNAKTDEINAAVNNVGLDAAGVKQPTLWQRIDNQTAVLGRLDGKIDAHAARDELMFRNVNDNLTDLADLRDILRSQ